MQQSWHNDHPLHLSRVILNPGALPSVVSNTTIITPPLGNGVPERGDIAMEYSVIFIYKRGFYAQIQ